MRVAGFDPGTVVVGWCVGEFDGPLATPQLVDAGVCRAKKGRPLERRLVELRADVESIRDEFRPDLIAVEQMVVYRGRKGSLSLGAAQSLILEVFVGFEIVRVNIRTAKKVVTGNGAAGKAVVGVAVQQIYKLAAPVDDENVSDAMAIAFAGYQRNTIRSKS